MFIIEALKKEETTAELKLLYRMIKKNFSYVPAHFELLATIDIQLLKEFLEYNQYYLTHKKIDSKLLPFLRLYIAQSECRSYCINLNTKLLLKNEVDENIVNNIIGEIENIPFERAQKLLALKTLHALYHADEFNADDLKELYEVGFNDKDFFDLLSYCTNFIARSKMIEVYLK